MMAEVKEEDEDGVGEVRLGNEDNLGHIREGLSKEWDGMRHSDMEIRCRGGKIIQAHRMVLAAISGVFRDVLRMEAEAEVVTVMLPDVEEEKLKGFLRGVYKGGEENVNLDKGMYNCT